MLLHSRVLRISKPLIQNVLRNQTTSEFSSSKNRRGSLPKRTQPCRFGRRLLAQE
jgi:hypothetical protein